MPLRLACWDAPRVVCSWCSFCHIMPLSYNTESLGKHQMQFSYCMPNEFCPCDAKPRNVVVHHEMIESTKHSCSCHYPQISISLLNTRPIHISYYPCPLCTSSKYPPAQARIWAPSSLQPCQPGYWWFWPSPRTNPCACCIRLNS